ncbi:hypothetical protein OF83DRAFT_1053207 [Amylostereum chailletii]|nr:hypothetical protein OF83DRAFT_1053207 [Amylostereum chailletii]
MFFRRALLSVSLLLLATLSPAAAQSSAPVSSTASPSPSALSSAATVTVIQTSTNVPITFSTRSGNQNIPLTTSVQTALNLTSTLTPTSTSAASISPSASASASASATPAPITLDTTLDPAFGVLGALLILTGLPSAFLGHKNRWTSFFLIGFYSLSLVCIVLILKFGVLDAVHPPSSTLRGMFVLASAVAGIAGGGVSIFFWKVTKYFIGAWGGFALGLWIQCFRDGGLVHSIGLRWILFLGCAVVGFVLCTLPKLHYHVVLISTAMVGASAVMLGVDCFTTANLKEFYVWNLGFTSLFPKYKNNGIQFPVTQTMEIELGLIGAISIMGAAVQFRVLHVLQRKLKEISEEQKRRQLQDDAKAAERFLNIDEEKADWDREHPTLGKHSRGTSEFSGTPLMKDADGLSTPTGDEGGFAARQRRPSGLSEFMAATPIEEEHRRGFRTSQLPGVLPALDLGNGIEGDVPQGFMSEDTKNLESLTPAELEDIKRKEELLAEIQTIRRSIDVLKAETPSNSTDSRSRQPSFTSRRTLSYDLNTAVLPEAAHARPERQRDPRARVQSMDMTRLASDPGPSIGRPTSAPLRDEDWDAYVRERKLLQPPAGVTSPIPTTAIPHLRTPSPRLAMSPAVQDALVRRQQRESMLASGDATPDVIRTGSDFPGLGLAAPAPKRSSYLPPTILPPAHRSPAPAPAASPRTVTYEELTERHREKMRQLQEPTTREQTERAEVEKARNRWERSKAVERVEVERRQAERAMEIQRHKQRNSDERNRPSTGSRHSRTLSADRLAGLGAAHTGSKRVSTMKVEDWQRYQSDAAPEPSSTRRKPGVPFPDGGRAAGHERGPSQRMSALPTPRDPPT